MFGRIVKETCGVIWQRLLDEGYLKCPSTPQEWKKVAVEFENYWDLNCLDAIDVKHVMFFNYKKYHSSWLMLCINSL